MSKLKIAIQKSGRLHNESIKLLKDCGIDIDNGLDRLKAPAHNFPLEVLYLRNSDIPQYVEDGVVDVAIVGENIILEKQKKVKNVLSLGFSKCRLSMAVQKDVRYASVSDLRGKRIATSYPVTLNKYLTDQNIEADVHVISGSVEIAPNIGLADAVCDLVSSGSTLFKNGLKEVEVILKSQACLVKSERLNNQIIEILDRLLFRINAVLAARNTRYILMNVPNNRIEEVSKLLPVLKSPTVMPLEQPGWSSLHTVIREEEFWDVIDKVKLAGAEGILVMPVEKIVK